MLCKEFPCLLITLVFLYILLCCEPLEIGMVMSENVSLVNDTGISD